MADIIKTVRLIEKQVSAFNIPWVTEVSRKKDPYRVLISCILSLRTKDKTTAQASQRLFAAADSPQEMVKLSALRLSRLIYPVGFYRNKARYILELSKDLLDNFGGKVPHRLSELIKLKGVGRKTANLVLGLGYQVPAICVDTHVHRISNRLGWMRTENPHQTEISLQRLLPRRYWIRLNTILVAFGQNVCLPISPYCSRCSVHRYCLRRGVLRFR